MIINLEPFSFLNNFYVTGETSMENKFSPVTLFYSDRDIIKSRWSRELHYWNDHDYSLVGSGKENREEEIIAGLSTFKQNV